MPALRQSLRFRRFLIFALAVVLAVAAICDWLRPPREQISVIVYNRMVIGGDRALLKPVCDRFIHCRFQPTCSHYSEEAMLAHGFRRGLWLTTSLLFRCMPGAPAGTRDPVPP